MEIKKTFTLVAIFLLIINYVLISPRVILKSDISFSASKNETLSATTLVNEFNEGTNIQKIINAAHEGEVVYLKAGTYLINNTIFVNKSISIIGENVKNTIIDGYGMKFPIFVISARNVTIKGLTIQNATIDASSGVAINIAKTASVQISNCVIKRCSQGIRLTDSQKCKITFNLFNDLGVGIYVRNGTSNLIAMNIFEGNGKGIWLSDEKSQGNLIYANNFINNGAHLELFNVNNTFCRGYPVGGNFWSDCSLCDYFNGAYQNETGSDGICDSQYMYDRYPLAGKITVFPLCLNGKTFYIDLISNADVGTLFFNGSEGTVTFWIHTVKNSSFCRVSIPKLILWCENKSNWKVTINEQQATAQIFEGNNYTCIYFTVNFSMYCKVKVSGEKSISLSPFQGDLNNDGIVDVQDLNELIQYYGKRRKDYNWNPYADLGPNDGEIDVLDFATFLYIAAKEEN